MSLGLDKFSDISLEPNLLVSSFIVSTTFVLVSMFLWSRSRSRLWDSDHFSLGLGLVIETQTFLVSVSVSSLRLRPFQSRSRSRHWDSDLSSLGLGLVIETQTFSVSVSVSMIQIWSRWSLGLVTPFWLIMFMLHVGTMWTNSKTLALPVAGTAARFAESSLNDLSTRSPCSPRSNTRGPSSISSHVKVSIVPIPEQIFSFWDLIA